MNNIIDRIKTEPAVIVQSLQAILGLLVAFSVIALTDDQTGAILATTAAALGVVLALSVRPFTWSVVTGFVQSGVVLLTAFGMEFTSEQTSSIYAVTAVLGAVFVRQTVTPETKLPPVALTTSEI